MGSSIIFLGTAGDHYVIGKQYRGSGGIVLKVDDNQFHIDPGPGTLNMAKQYNVNLRETSVVLVSHNHLGHCNDVNAVIDAMTYSGLDKKGVLVSCNSFVNGRDKMRAGLTEYHKNCVEKIIVLEPGKRVAIDNVEILGLPTEHLDSDTVGFKFFTPDFVMSYSSDTKLTPELINSLEDSDILVLNVTNPGDEKSDKLNAEDVVKIITKVTPKLVIMTHFGIKMLKADPIVQAREIQKRTGIQVIAAKDGMAITPTAYSAHSLQKTLLDVEKFKPKPRVEEVNIDLNQMIDDGEKK